MRLIHTIRINCFDTIVLSLVMFFIVPIWPTFYHATNNAHSQLPKSKEAEYKKKHLLPFEEREAYWNQLYENAEKNGQTLPTVSQKYSLIEVYLLNIQQENGEWTALFENKIDSTILRVKRGDKFWDGSVMNINDNCVEIDDIRDTTKHNTKSILKLYLSGSTR